MRQDSITLNYSTTASRQAQHLSFMQQATSLLEQAKQQGFHNPAVLKQASQALLQAIQAMPKDPEAYVQMAYLWYLLMETIQAAFYLDSALSLAPEHAAALNLKGLLEKIQGIVFEPVLDLGFRRFNLSRLTAGAAQDCDALYDELAQMIQNQVYELMQVPPPLPVDHEERFSRLEQASQWLNKLCTQILERMRLLEQELDTHTLQTRFRALETLSKRFERALNDSWQISQLQQEIQTQKQKTIQCLSMINQSEEQPEPDVLALMHLQLEYLLDSVDQLESQLQPFKQPGIELPLVEKEFKTLQFLLDALQESLEEAPVQAA